MNLNRIEAQSALWLKLKGYMNEQLDLARRKNDGNLDQFETARLRGRIAALKELIALEESPVVPVADEQQ